MAINKVEYGGDTLIDLTNDTVTPETLMEGATAHNAAGEQITGTAKSGGGSVQSDWNVSDENDPAYVKNRTHYSAYEYGDTLTWDGTLTDVAADLGGELYFCKVSDVVLTPDAVKNGFTFGIFGVGSFDSGTYGAVFDENGNGAIGEYILLAGSDNASVYGITLPEKGIYFILSGGTFVDFLKVPGVNGFLSKSIVAISAEYLPGSLISKGVGAYAEVFNGLPAEAASGYCAHAEGEGAVASGRQSHAEGERTTASGTSSHAEGFGAEASGGYSHAEGDHTKATALYSHAEGQETVASGIRSHAEGGNTTASGEISHAEGFRTTASNCASHAQGKYNKPMTDGGTLSNTVGDAMVIGNGTGPLSNAFRVTFAGETYGLSAFNSSGADYAEFFEWADFNHNAEDRVGYFVTLDGKHIRIAKPGDYILGIVSGQPCIIGNSDEDWLGRWEHDEFGRFIKEDVETPVTEMRPVEVPLTDANGKQILNLTKTEMQEVETGEVIKGWRYKANPDYDPTQLYIERKDRQEWDCVGMLGVLSVRDDGTCEVNGFCTVADGGIATKADSYIPGMTYRVMERVSDGVVKVVFR